ncbi:MAG TPA: GerAB/ArcD/ProY family transporter [Firmicutes bacterium]|nr:GerAB/ArcD/ProY family transporter [Bacillota bacterium]
MSPSTHNLGYTETVALLAAYTGSKVFTSCPSQLVYLSSTSAWITAMLSVIPAALGVIAIYRFVDRFDGITFQRCVELTIGKPLGKMVGLGFLSLILGMDAIALREFSAGFKSAILPETPLNAIIVLGEAVTAYTATLGLEPLGRFIAIAFLPLSILLLAIVFGAFHMELSIAELFPLWGTGAEHTVLGSVQCSSLYADIFAFALLVPYVREEKAGQRLHAGLVSLGLSGLAMAIAIAVGMMSFTAPTLAQMLFPVLQLARLFLSGIFLERIEAIFVFAWLFFGSIKVAFGHWLAASLAADIIGVKRWTAFVWPSAVITYFLAIQPENLTDLFVFQVTVLRSVGWLVAYVLPAVLLGIAGLRGIGSK